MPSANERLGTDLTESIMMTDDRRHGFTIIEMLIVILGITILLGLLLMSVQRVRESANRSQCANHLVQIGMAFAAHADQHGWFPDAGRYWGDARSKNADGTPKVAPYQDWGWGYQVLPFLGMSANWATSSDQKAAGTVTALYFCPTRRPPISYPGVETGGLASSSASAKRGAIDYAGNGGNTKPEFPSGSPNFASPKNGVVIPRKNFARLSPANISDGAATTLLVGERNFNIKRAGQWWAQWDENNGYFNGWDWDTIRWSHGAPAPDRFDNSIYDRRFGSSHPGGLNFVFADGSTRFINFGISLATFQKLSIRNDGGTLSEGF